MPWRRSSGPPNVALLGYFGGSAFEESLWKPILAAGLVATAVAGGAELLRRTRLS